MTTLQAPLPTGTAGDITVAADLTWDGTTTLTTGDTSGVLVNDFIKFDADGQYFRVSAITANVDITILNPGSLTIPSGSGAGDSSKVGDHGALQYTYNACVDGDTMQMQAGTYKLGAPRGTIAYDDDGDGVNDPIPAVPEFFLSLGGGYSWPMFVPNPFWGDGVTARYGSGVDFMSFNKAVTVEGAGKGVTFLEDDNWDPAVYQASRGGETIAAGLITVGFAGESIGAGATPSGTLSNIPVSPKPLGSNQRTKRDPVKVMATIGATVRTLEDNGAGGLCGPDGTGTINYTTGAISVTWNAAPTGNTTVDYRQSTPKSVTSIWCHNAKAQVYKDFSIRNMASGLTSIAAYGLIEDCAFEQSGTPLFWQCHSGVAFPAGPAGLQNRTLVRNCDFDNNLNHVVPSLQVDFDNCTFGDIDWIAENAPHWGDDFPELHGNIHRGGVFSGIGLTEFLNEPGAFGGIFGAFRNDISVDNYFKNSDITFTGSSEKCGTILDVFTQDSTAFRFGASLPYLVHGYEVSGNALNEFTTALCALYDGIGNGFLNMECSGPGGSISNMTVHSNTLTNSHGGLGFVLAVPFNNVGINGLSVYGNTLIGNENNVLGTGQPTGHLGMIGAVHNLTIVDNDYKQSGALNISNVIPAGLSNPIILIDAASLGLPFPDTFDAVFIKESGNFTPGQGGPDQNVLIATSQPNNLATVRVIGSSANNASPEWKSSINKLVMDLYNKNNEKPETSWT